MRINTNRSLRAQDMAITTAREENVRILLINEPIKNVIKDRKDWMFDEEIDTAIKILDRNIAVNRQGHGHGFTYFVTNAFTVYSCYASPNKEIDDLERTLTEIGIHLRSHKEKSIILGDFNGKSAQWGMRNTDKRGEALVEWMAENELICQNHGNRPTFHRHNAINQ